MKDKKKEPDEFHIRFNWIKPDGTVCTTSIDKSGILFGVAVQCKKDGDWTYWHKPIE